MASGDEWDAQKILDRYIHDYMVKKNMPDAADIFANEANVNQNPVVIDSPESFLTEWWSIFWDVYSAKKPNHEEANRESSSKAPMMMENEQMAMQFPCGTNCNNMMGQPLSSLLPAKLFEEIFMNLLGGEIWGATSPIASMLVKTTPSISN